MFTVSKYKVPSLKDGYFDLIIPANCNILKFAILESQPYLWVSHPVSPVDYYVHHFLIIETNHSIASDQSYEYVGSEFYNNQEFHLFRNPYNCEAVQTPYMRGDLSQD